MCKGYDGDTPSIYWWEVPASFTRGVKATPEVALKQWIKGVEGWKK